MPHAHYKIYNKTVQIYTNSQSIPIAKGCFAYMFTNVGDTIGFIDGMIVHPSATPATALGDSRTISGHTNDLYTGLLNLAFQAPVGVSPAIEVVQLYYIM